MLFFVFCFSISMLLYFLRSSHTQVFYRTANLKSFPKLMGKYLYGVFFSKSVAQICNFNKKGLYHRCFSLNFKKFFWTVFLQSTSEQLLLLKGLMLKLGKTRKKRHNTYNRVYILLLWQPYLKKKWQLNQFQLHLNF